jgi:hypothetical protein
MRMAIRKQSEVIKRKEHMEKPSENNTVGLDPVDPMPWDEQPEGEPQEGVQCPKCLKHFSNEVGLRMHHIRKHEGRDWDTAKNFKSKSKKGKGKPWTDEQRANFRKTMRRKMREKAAREQGIEKDRIQIVYPDPRLDEAIKNTWPEEVAVVPQMKFCPHCGENVAGWRYEP